MSFLLEALRKSENQKHRGDVPTIHSSTGLELRSQSPFKPGLIALILLPAVLVLAWYAWQSSKQEEDIVAPAGPSAVGVDTPVNDESVVVEPAPMTASTASENTLPSDPPVMSRSPSVRPLQQDKEDTDAARTPVETFNAPIAVTQAEPEVERTGTSQVKQADTQSQREASSANENVTSQSAPAEILAGREPQQRDFREPSLDAISYWRLPQSIREDLGSLKISVLVYSEKPDDRFIIMNGRRLSEGEEPQSGLVLREISREGAVFSYRLYRFLVSR